MKKFFYLLTLVLTTAIFIACEPDENDWVRPDDHNWHSIHSI